MTLFRELAVRAPGWLPDIALAPLTGKATAWVAVTGLSRSGKTVFITSLIHNLLSVAQNANRLPLLSAAAEGRLKAARIAAPQPEALPRFPYETNIRQMAAAPAHWPPRTEGLSEIEIDIRFVRKGFVARLGGDAATLRLRIIDYPGEWLLDLPLLSQTYAQWSMHTLARMRLGLRAEIARDYLAYAADHLHSERAADEVARRASELYRDYLFAARDRHGLTYLQPGRFLCPGPVSSEAPYLWFAPLEPPVGWFSAGTLGALMEERFEAYKKELVETFYTLHFRRYSRQVILVDVLRAFMAGPDAFEDTQLAVEEILRSFRYGRGGILRTLLHGRRIDRALLAATKADHVPQIQRDNLTELLRNLAAIGTTEVQSSDAVVKAMPLASVLSTTDDTEQIGGHRVQVVVGRPVGGARRQAFFVGNVPIRPPGAAAWNAPFLNVPEFEPPIIDRAPVSGIPHVNLDAALEYLIGDYLK